MNAFPPQSEGKKSGVILTSGGREHNLECVAVPHQENESTGSRDTFSRGQRVM